MELIAGYARLTERCDDGARLRAPLSDLAMPGQVWRLVSAGVLHTVKSSLGTPCLVHLGNSRPTRTWDGSLDASREAC